MRGGVGAQTGDLQQKAEVTRARLEALKGVLARRKDLLRSTAAEKALKHQAKRAQLQENNLYVSAKGERDVDGREGHPALHRGRAPAAGQ